MSTLASDHVNLVREVLANLPEGDYLQVADVTDALLDLRATLGPIVDAQLAAIPGKNIVERRKVEPLFAALLKSVSA